MFTNRETTSLKNLCLKAISRRPFESLNDEKVHGAFFSLLATAMIARSNDLTASYGSRRLDTREIRQGIVKELVENGGRSVHNDFPLPKNFFEDDAFEALSFAHSRISVQFVGEHIASKCPSLKELDLSGCFLVTDKAILVILKGCSRLKSLTLNSCRKLYDLSCEYFVSKAPCLESLNLGGCYNMTVFGITHLLQDHPNRNNFLELDFSGLYLTDKIIQLMYKNCPILSKVGIGFIAVTEQTLRATVTTLAPTLTTLRLHWCPPASVSDSFVGWLSKSAPQLSTLDITGCKNVTIYGIQPLLDSRNGGNENSGESDITPISQLTIKYTGVTKQQTELIEAGYRDIKLVK